MRTFTLLLLSIPWVATGCSQDRCATDGRAAPGAGVASAGVRLCLGDSLEQARAACDLARVYDLGPTGVQVVCPEQHLIAHLAASDDGPRITAVSLLAGAAARTPEGIGPGSTRGAVEAAYGPPPSVEPFQGSSRYPNRGLAFTYNGDQVVTAQVTDPTP